MRIIIAVLVLVVLAVAAPAAPACAERNDEALVGHAFGLLSPLAQRRAEARAALLARGRVDAAPALILALRYARADESEIDRALRALTGSQPGGEAGQSLWHRWMIWQETRVDVVPFAGFDRLLSATLARHDPEFASFLHPGIRHEIRLSEIAWGGVAVDGIPALDHPPLMPAAEARYLDEGDLVFGVAIADDARAYPLRILDWHEMVNDTVGGVPVSLAYCTLCGSGILFEGRVAGREEALTFGSSGLLYRSNKLMYDRQTRSLWNQFTGRPVVGPLNGSGIVLRTRPVAITTWADWRRRNPATRVLSPDTGHDRDYSPGAAYGSYFSSQELMFPAAVDERRLKAKDYVFALRGAVQDKAWPLSMFESRRVVNDSAGALRLTLVGEAATRTVRAYRTGGEAFEAGSSPDVVMLDGNSWRVKEDALAGPDGRTMPRLPGHIAYWFAWNGYLGGSGELAEPAK